MLLPLGDGLQAVFIDHHVRDVPHLHLRVIFSLQNLIYLPAQFRILPQFMVGLAHAVITGSTRNDDFQPHFLHLQQIFRWQGQGQQNVRNMGRRGPTARPAFNLLQLDGQSLENGIDGLLVIRSGGVQRASWIVGVLHGVFVSLA